MCYFGLGSAKLNQYCRFYDSASSKMCAKYSIRKRQKPEIVKLLWKITMLITLFQIGI
jgi:hypothetical protein